MPTTATVVPEPFVLSSLPPSRAQKRLALAVVAAMLVTFFVASGPLSQLEPPRITAFVPAYTMALVFSDLITAILLFSQFSIFRTRALLVISSGYLFTALMPIPWILMFPGVFVPEGFLIGGLQSRAYIYFFWHAGFPIFVMSYVLLKDADPSRRYWRGTTAGAIALTVASTAAVVAALTLFFALGDSLLPHVELEALRSTTDKAARDRSCLSMPVTRLSYCEIFGLHARTLDAYPSLTSRRTAARTGSKRPGIPGLWSAPSRANIASSQGKYAAAIHESSPTMTDTLDALIFDLLEYVACKERGYTEVMEAWRTSCPRLPVWEEANERRFITRVRANGHAVVLRQPNDMLRRMLALTNLDDLFTIDEGPSG